MVEEIKEKYWSRFSTTYDENQEYVVGKDFLNEVKLEKSSKKKTS